MVRDAGSLVVRAADEAEAVGQQRQAAHRACVVREVAQDGAVVDVEELDGLVARLREPVDVIGVREQRRRAGMLFCGGRPGAGARLRRTIRSLLIACCVVATKSATATGTKSTRLTVDTQNKQSVAPPRRPARKDSVRERGGRVRRRHRRRSSSRRRRPRSTSTRPRFASSQREAATSARRAPRDFWRGAGCRRRTCSTCGRLQCRKRSAHPRASARRASSP